MIALALLLAPVAQMQMHDMPGMTMPMPPARPARAKPKPRPKAAPLHKAAPATPAPCPPEHAAMGHCAAAGQPPRIAPAMPDMPGMAMAPAKPAAAATIGTDQPAGDAPPPAPPGDRAAARFYDPAAMAAADRQMRREHGGMHFGQVMFDLAEVQIRDGRDGLRWDGEGWFGGDRDRLVVKSEGDGRIDRIDRAEVQALYSRAIGPYFDLQAGLRQDVGAASRRSYATIGVEGLAPYWFQVEGALFLSDRGDLLGRVQAYTDQRITQRLILQPRVELNLAAQAVPQDEVAAGLSQAEAGVRLRYEIRREFAPYAGISWEHRRGDGNGAALVLGVRSWF